jgi:hypothetical protein
MKPHDDFNIFKIFPILKKRGIWGKTHYGEKRIWSSTYVGGGGVSGDVYEIYKVFHCRRSLAIFACEWYYVQIGSLNLQY